MTTRQKPSEEIVKQLVKQCVQTRSYDLMKAIAAAEPVVIAQALIQGELISSNLLPMPTNTTSSEQASKILTAVSAHVEIAPEPALKCFIKVLHDSNSSTLKEIAKNMAKEMGYSIYDAGNPAPISTLPPRDRSPITRDVQMDDNGEEPGKSGRVMKDAASNTDVTTTSSTRDKTWSPYKMNKDRHGIALVISNIKWQLDKDGQPLMENRDGAEKDVDDLEESLEAIGYRVIHEDNLTVDDMKLKLKKVCADKRSIVSSNDDSFICYIASHGFELGVYGVDKKYVSVDELSKILEPDESSKLKQKPKIFFVQACRGGKVSQPVDGGNGKSKSRVPRRADFYFSYATDPGHLAARHPYTQLLSKCLNEYSAQLSLDEIVMKVHEEIAREVYGVESGSEIHEHMQIGEVVHTMRGPVYFK